MESKKPDDEIRDLTSQQGVQCRSDTSSQNGAGRKKGIFRAIALSVGSLFMIALVVFGWWAYRQWSDMKEMVEIAGRISSAVESNIRAVSRSARQSRGGENPASLHPAMRASTTGQSELPASVSRMFFPGPGRLPRGVPEIMRNPQKIFMALSKYKDRPLVREFLTELNLDPELKKALENGSTGNPIKLFAQIHNMKNLTKVIEKYAIKPDFAILLVEVMNDPELKPFFEGIDPGIPGRMAAKTGMPPAWNSPPPHAEDRAEEANDFQTMTLDPSKIQGNKSTAGVSVRPAVVPPP